MEPTPIVGIDTNSRKTHFSDDMKLLQRLFHLQLCLLVLVCPATRGQCCGGADELEVAVSDVCQHGCCGDKAEKPARPAPIEPKCPERCHDCFCAGALPPAFETPVPQVDWDALVTFVKVNDESPMISSGHFKPAFMGEPGYGFRPPSGRELLISNCTLLL